jgi:hypothetical protein
MDADDFEAALSANFAESGFVSSLRTAEPHCKNYIAICRREALTSISDMPQQSAALSLTVTDCLSGIFRKRFGRAEFAEMRQEVGMAEFAWGTFFKLLALALNSRDSCSALVELQQPHSDATSHGPHMHLTLRFQLQAAALVTRVDLGTCTDGPSAALGIEAYLRELHVFMVDAVAASRGSYSDSQAAPLQKDGISQSASSSLQERALPCSPLTLGALTSCIASTSGRKPDNVVKSTQAGKVAAPKKRAAGSLVDPHARRLRGSSANPFQLSR